MRKQNLLLLIILLTISYSRSYAGLVSVPSAQTVALNFFKGHFPAATADTAVLYYTRTETDGTIDYYIFNLSPARGFVIVAADNNMTPVIAYSSESYFRINTKTGIVNWMSDAGNYIHSAILRGDQADAAITSTWAACLRGPYAPSLRTGNIGPLVPCRYDQETDTFPAAPPYLYNLYCPYNTADAERTVTGCVATAMTQIMKYWNYPTTGVGSYSYLDTTQRFDSVGHYIGSYNYGTLSANFGTTTYRWSIMPTELLLNSPSSDDSAVSLMMYHAGISVAMQYDDDDHAGSGSCMSQYDAGGGTRPCAQRAYYTYFRYNPNTIRGMRYASYTSAQWMDSIEQELNAGRPIQYAGNDPVYGGHSWVCDGYDPSNSEVHMNWGWSGLDDGFFAVTNLSPAGTGYNFSTSEEMLIGIEPLVNFQVSASAAVNSLCAGDSTRLSVTGAPPLSTYTWTPTTGLSCTTCASPYAAPTATTIYTVTVDSAGFEATDTAIVAVSNVPAAPASATLPTAPCSGHSATYSVPAVSGATSYVWSVTGTGWSGTSTTNSINLTAGTVSASVSVKASDACGSGAAYTFTAPISTVPDSPTTISVPSPVCSGSSATFSTPAVSGATSYDWTVSGTGWSGSSTTDAITLTAGTGPLAISVKAVNTCGSSHAYSLSSVPVVATPVAGFSISSDSVTIGTSVSIAFTGTAPAGSTYTWDFDGGTATPGTGAGPQSVSWATTGTEAVSLTVNNGGCSSATFTDSVLVEKNTTGINPLANVSIGAINIIPNPSSGQANIILSMATGADISITLYDISGRLLGTIYTGQLGAGENSISFDTESIVSGIYLIKASDGKSSMLKRFVKL